MILRFPIQIFICGLIFLLCNFCVACGSAEIDKTSSALSAENPYPRFDSEDPFLVPIMGFYVSDGSVEELSEGDAVLAIEEGLEYLPTFGRYRYELIDFVLALDAPVNYVYEERGLYIQLLEGWLRDRGYGRTDVLHFFVVPPLRIGGEAYSAGLANRTGSYRKRFSVALGNLLSVNSAGVVRESWMPKVIAHELGHLLGANHYGGPTLDGELTVMHPAACRASLAQGIDPGGMRFHWSSIHEIGRGLYDGNKSLRGIS